MGKGACSGTLCRASAFLSSTCRGSTDSCNANGGMADARRHTQGQQRRDAHPSEDVQDGVVVQRQKRWPCSDVLVCLCRGARTSCARLLVGEEIEQRGVSGEVGGGFLAVSAGELNHADSLRAPGTVSTFRI